MALMLSDALVVFDHLKHTVTILANADLVEDPDVELAHRKACARIEELRAALAGPVPRPAGGEGERTPPAFESNMPRERFEAIVERIVRYIHAGDAFQVVPSQRWSAPVPVEAFSIYRGLRAINPSPYMYFLDFGDFQVAGASPEPLLTVTGRHVSTKPIAGTRPRGATPEEDRRIAAELLADEKERAEHVMLVDLGRNDLGARLRVRQRGRRRADGDRALQPRHAHRLLGRRARCARASARWTRCARCCRPGPCRARRRCARCRSSTSSSRSSAAATAAPSATSPTAATSTPRSTSAPSSSRTASPTCRPAAGPSPTPQPAYEYDESVAKAAGRDARHRAGLPAAGVGMRVLVLDNYDSFTYNLVQYLGELGAEVQAVRNDRATVDELLELDFDRCVVSPGPCTPNEAGITLELVRRMPEAGVPTLGVCLGHQAMAQAFGGEVRLNPPVHGKATTIEHDGRTIFSGLRCPLRGRRATTR